MVTVGARVQRAAAQRHAAETSRSLATVAAEPPLNGAAAAHRAGGADPLGSAQTHNGRWRDREMERLIDRSRQVLQ